MKKLSLFILACICTLGSYADDVAVFNALVNRLLPNYSSQITGKKLPEGKNDYFQLSSVGDKIEIAGNNANSMSDSITISNITAIRTCPGLWTTIWICRQHFRQ